MVLELQISETSRSVTHQFKEFVFRTVGATHVWNFIFAEALNPLTRFNPEMATDLSGAGFYARMEIARSTIFIACSSRVLAVSYAASSCTTVQRYPTPILVQARIDLAEFRVA